MIVGFRTTFLTSCRANKNLCPTFMFARILFSLRGAQAPYYLSTRRHIMVKELVLAPVPSTTEATFQYLTTTATTKIHFANFFSNLVKYASSVASELSLAVGCGLASGSRVFRDEEVEYCPALWPRRNALSWCARFLLICCRGNERGYSSDDLLSRGGYCYAQRGSACGVCEVDIVPWRACTFAFRSHFLLASLFCSADFSPHARRSLLRHSNLLSSRPSANIYRRALTFSRPCFASHELPVSHRVH